MEGKRYFSWQAIQKTVANSAARILSDFQPTLIVAISGGGLVPARLLRTYIKAKTSKNLPIQCIGLVHYDDDDKSMEHVQRTQWLSPDFDISGHKVLLVDEVDDSRKTIAFAVQEMLTYFDEAEAAHKGHSSWVRPTLGAYVVHNKLREKVSEISSEVFPHNYFALDVPNRWNVYPWDALDIDLHSALADAQDREGQPEQSSISIPRPRTGSPICGSPVSGSPVYRGGAGSLLHLPRVGSGHRLEVMAGSPHC
mmetsp:Transcript_34899/g.77570  ORF Transcript_34899/g.77570 Transcript_34899/m.77570 type:complete len:253 (+) Transcript_34899:204-962(+)